MTGGAPPQPKLSVKEDQIILAKRLMAKEVLEALFQSGWLNLGGLRESSGYQW